MALTDFYQKTTKNFSITVTFNSATPDISSDTVTIAFKSQKSLADAAAEITSTADVATAGATGVATFNISDENTNVQPGKYNYEIKWTKSGGDVHILESGIINILDRVYD